MHDQYKKSKKELLKKFTKPQKNKKEQNTKKNAHTFFLFKVRKLNFFLFNNQLILLIYHGGTTLYRIDSRTLQKNH